MNNKLPIIVILGLCIGLGAFSFSKSISLWREIKLTLEPKINQLEQDKSKISAELKSLRASLNAKEDENSMIRQELNARNDALEQIKGELSKKDKDFNDIMQKYSDTSSEQNLMNDNYSQMYMEFAEMRKAFSSVSALQERIRELKNSKVKKNSREPRKREGQSKLEIGVKKAKNEIKKTQETLREDSMNKNGGFLVKDGKSTYIPKVRIEVNPID